MGLDMYLTGDKYKRSETDAEYNQINVEYVDGFPRKSQRLDLGYWRKYAPLHQYIVNTYADGEDNCRVIDLSIDDLYNIADACRNNRLPANKDCGGFFFGDDEWWDELRKEGEIDAKTFEDAAKWLKSEEDDDNKYWHSVEYCASW